MTSRHTCSISSSDERQDMAWRSLTRSGPAGSLAGRGSKLVVLNSTFDRLRLRTLHGEKSICNNRLTDWVINRQTTSIETRGNSLWGRRTFDKCGRVLKPSQARRNPSRCLVASETDRNEKPGKQVPLALRERLICRSCDGRSYDWKIVVAYDIPRGEKRSSDRSPTRDRRTCPDPESERREKKKKRNKAVYKIEYASSSCII